MPAPDGTRSHRTSTSGLVDVVLTIAMRDLGKPRDRERENAALKRLLAYVEAARRVVHPILDDAVPVHEYEPGTWGPRRRNKKVPRGDIWPDPEPPDAG